MLSLTSELELKGKHYSISTVCVEFSEIKEFMFKWGIVNSFGFKSVQNQFSPNQEKWL